MSLPTTRILRRGAAVIAGLLAIPALHGAAADLFFSEYVEGSSNNKYLEIFNGTGQTVNLTDYEVRLFSNQATTPTNTVKLDTASATLASDSVLVLKNSGAVPYAGAATVASVCNFNGDDAVGLYKSGVLVDLIGRIGEDPGSEWSAGALSTANQTLVRKASVSAGVAVNPASGFPTLAAEWETFPQDTVSNLGTHTFTGGSDKPEPSEFPSAFTATADGPDLVLTWTPSGGGQVPDSYSLLLSSSATAPADPVDGTPVADDLDGSDGTVAINVPGSVSTYRFAGLPGPATWRVKIVPSTNFGASINFKTGATPTAQADTPRIIAQSTFDDLAEWTIATVANTVWTSASGRAVANGFGKAGPADDWLISAPLDLSTVSQPLFRFVSWTRYLDSGLAEPGLAVLVSQNYSGTGDPSTATWTALPATLSPEDSQTDTSSGDLDLSAYKTGGPVHLAFHYRSSGTTNGTCESWQVDNAIVYDSSTATPGNLTLSLNPTAVAEGDGAIAQSTGTVTASPLPTASLTVNLAANPAGQVTLPATVTIPAGQPSATFTVTAVNDGPNDGNQTITIAASASGYNAASASLQVADASATPLLLLSLNPATVPENAGASASQATITLSQAAPAGGLTVALNSTDPKAIVPVALTIPSGQLSATFPVGVQPDLASNSDRGAVISAAAVGYTPDNKTLTITNVPAALDLSIDITSFPETAGPNAATGTVTVTYAPASDLTVTLTNETPDVITIPGSVVIPAGQLSATFAVGAILDAAAAGDRSASWSASAPGYAGAALIGITVQNTPARLTLAIEPATIAENAGLQAALGTITLSFAAATHLNLTIANSDPTEAAVPATVLVQAGRTTATFPIDAVADGRFDADAAVTLTASASGWESGQASLTVTNVDPRTSPKVTLLTPQDGGQYDPLQTVRLNALPFVDDGYVTRVSFLLEGVEFETVTGFPYAADWTPTAPGVYHWQAEVEDSLGNTDRSAVATVTVTSNPDQSPSVQILAPTFGAVIYFGESLTIEAEASSPYSTIQTVQFYANGQEIGTVESSPYLLDWTPERPGFYLIEAEAVDAEDRTALSEAVEVLVEGLDPTSDTAVFVQQTFLDLFNEAPLDYELEEYTAKLDTGEWSHAQLVAHLLTVPLYRDPFRITAAFSITLGDFPTWADMWEATVTNTIITDPVEGTKIEETFTGFADLLRIGITATDLSYLQDLRGLSYFLTHIARFNRLYGQIDTLSDRELFQIVFYNKHGVAPTAQQLQQGETRIANADPKLGFNGDRYAFLEAFITDKKFGALDIIYNPPNQNHVNYSNSAVLMSAFWRTKPSLAEAAALSALPILEQIDTVLNHPRYLDRFGLTTLDAYNLGQGWKWSPWLGFFYDHTWPWLWHPELGWIYPAGFDDRNFWFYSPSRGWLWSARALGSYAWSVNDRVWVELQ